MRLLDSDWEKVRVVQYLGSSILDVESRGSTAG